MTNPIIDAMAEAIRQVNQNTSGLKYSELTHEMAQACYEIVRPMMAEWRPIEDAPRDGTQIIGAHINGNDILGVQDIIYRNEGGYDCPWESKWTHQFFKPSHFMFLPQPPEKSE